MHWFQCVAKIQVISSLSLLNWLLWTCHWFFFFNYVVSYFFYFIAASVGKYEGETFSVLPCSSKFFDNFFSFWSLFYWLASYISFNGFFQIGNILNIHDVPNIWHVPLLLRVGLLTVLWFLLLIFLIPLYFCSHFFNVLWCGYLFQNQNAHHSILKQLNLLRLVFLSASSVCKA